MEERRETSIEVSKYRSIDGYYSIDSLRLLILLMMMRSTVVM